MKKKKRAMKLEQKKVLKMNFKEDLSQTNQKMNDEDHHVSNKSWSQTPKPSVNIQQIRENFDEIKISLHHLLIDPFL